MDTVEVHTDFKQSDTNNSILNRFFNIMNFCALDLVISVRIANSSDPDFIEVEIPRWKLTYANLMKICCEELEILESHVERIRKLPNIRLRKDSDVKRLVNFQSLEMVLKSASGDKTSNCYQSISTCKDQTILY